MNKAVNVEIFTAPGCNKCGRAVTRVKDVASELGDEKIQWRRVDVVDELDYAVEMGIRATPGIAINGVLVFTAMPSANTLREAIQSQLAKQDIP